MRYFTAALTALLALAFLYFTVMSVSASSSPAESDPVGVVAP